MRHQNGCALDTSWEAALLNIKLGALHMVLVLDNILLPFTLQSISFRYPFFTALVFSVEKHANHCHYFYSKEVSVFGFTLHSH